jgi:two-component system response regulator ResD
MPGLERAGHTVEHVPDGAAALARVCDDRPDLVVLDPDLPGTDGLNLCRRLRAMGALPVIMLTARDAEQDRIAGLEAGADDCVTKPFSPRELELRVLAVLRRAGPTGHAQVPNRARLTLDDLTHSVAKDGASFPLTVREFDLLAHFMRHPCRTHSRDELIRDVWGWEHGDPSTVTVHVRRLRSKIEDDPAHPRHIQTVWGAGYRFDPFG